ncbi:MAG: hypothetical protein IKN17_12080 [Ruminococcus sp.]|nr:hypothetical protein [Ruminococcus sp.]
MSRPKFCGKCGNPLADSGKFCGKCGNPILDTDEAPAPSPEGIAQAAETARETVGVIPEQPAPGFEQPAPGFEQPSAVPYSNFEQPSAVPSGAPTPAMNMGKNIGAAFVKHKVPIIISLAAIAVIVAAIIIIVNLTNYQKIDAQKLFAFKFSGLNGQGTAVGYLNCSEADPDPYGYEYDANGNPMEKEYSDFFSYDKKALLKAYDKASDKEEATEMKNALLAKSKGEYDLKVKLSKDSGISNGDKITCTVEYDEEELKEAKIKLENTEFEIEAEGLLEGTELDMFKDFEVKFTGMDERGSVEYDSTSKTYPFISYYLSDGSSYNLKNGDVLTFQASVSYGAVEKYQYIDNNDYTKGVYFKYDGTTYIVTETSPTKQFTVSGLSEAQTVDIFNGVKFNTSGAVPFLRINSVNKDEVESSIGDNVSYYIDTGDNNYLKVGDTFKVKAYVSSSLLEAGYKPEGTPDEDGYYIKEFSVDDSYGYYLTADATLDDMAKFQAKFDEYVNKFKEDYVDRTSLGGVKVDGKIKSFDTFEPAAYYLALMNSFEDGTVSAYDTKSYLYVAYKVTMTVEKDEGKTAKKTFYAAWRLGSPYVDANGEGQLESSFAMIYAKDKLADIVSQEIKKTEDARVVQIGGSDKSDDSKKDDDSSKKADDSSKDEEGDESSKKADESEKEDESSEQETESEAEAESGSEADE